MFKRSITKQLFVGALLGLFYYITQLIIRPEPYMNLTYEAGKFLKSIAVGIIIYMILYLLKLKKTA